MTVKFWATTLAALGVTLSSYLVWQKFKSAPPLPTKSVSPTEKKQAYQRWPLGVQTSVKIDFLSSGTLTQAGRTDTAGNVAAKLRGEATAVVLTSTAKMDSIFVAWQFDCDELSLTTGRQGRDGFSLPNSQWLVFAQYGANGNLLAITGAATLAPAVLAVLTDFLRVSQVTLAEGFDPTSLAGTPLTWQAQEEDINGTYIAEYAADRDQDGLRLAKKRNRIGQNAGTFKFTTAGWTGNQPTRLEVSDAETSNISGAALTSISERSLHMVAVGTESLTEGVMHDLLSRYQSITSAPTSRSNAKVDSFSRNTLGDTSWPDLRAQLDSAGNHGAVSKPVVARKLVALLSLDPSVTPAYEALLKQASAGTFSLHALAAALVEVGTPAAQSALCATIAARLAESQAAFTLMVDTAQLAHPDRNTLDFWHRLAVDTTHPEAASIAGLALGAAAHHLSGDDAAALTAPFRQELESGPETARTLFLLQVLGNGGQTTDLGTVVKLSAATDPSIRREALLALRFQTASAAEATLVEALAHDANADVRRSAAQALAYQPITEAALQTLTSAASIGSDVALQLEAIDTLWSKRAANASIPELIARIAAQNPGSKASRHAAKLLDQNAAS